MAHPDGPTPTPEPERYRLTLVALPASGPVIIRLRRILKALLRSYGFRCEKCEPLAPDASAPPPGDSP